MAVAYASPNIIAHVKIGELFYNLDTDKKVAEVTAEQLEEEENYLALMKVIVPSTIQYNANSYNVIGIGEGAFHHSINLI